MYSTNCTHLKRGYCTIGSSMVPEDSRGYGDRWAKYPHFIWSHFACSIGNVIPTSEHTFLPLFNTCLGHSHIFTVRNEVAKVMFLQASVCPQGGVSISVHARIPLPPGADIPQEQTPPPEQTPPRSRHPRSRHPPPPQRDGHCCGRYASYWNAFL